ncbi:MAG: response regulator transcription factor [Pseudomonadota bacterium]
MATNSIKILAADDHWIARSALANLLRALDREPQVLEAGDFDETLKLVHANPDLDLILLDLVMPGMDGMEGLETLRRTAPEIPVVVVSVNEDRAMVLKAVGLGAAGYVPKTSSGDEILTAIKRVLAGDLALPRRIIERYQTQKAEISVEPEGADGLDIGCPDLTARQEQILDLMGSGLSNAQIAEKLGISINTVRVHIHGLVRRLRLQSRTQAALYAARRLDQKSTGGNVGAALA